MLIALVTATTCIHFMYAYVQIVDDVNFARNPGKVVAIKDERNPLMRNTLDDV